MQHFTLKNYSYHTLHYRKHALDHRYEKLINRSCKYIVISGLYILIHYCIHECIIISYLSIYYIPFHADILEIEVFIQFTYSSTLSTMIFTSLYSLILSQYHEPKPHKCQWYSWIGSNSHYCAKYCGLIPW